MRTTRCDLHIHSAASLGNDEWYTRLFGWPESYAEPARQYELCKARGMSLVTLTDHDTIDGGLTLIDRPDFFLSEEVTARFPENGCVMHVLAWNITRDQHDEIQARRNDIYRLCEYLNGAAIAHGLAHPLLSPNARLDAATFEKVLLMFPTLEGTNGLTDRRIEPDLTTMLERLTPEVIAALARKHGIDPERRGAAPEGADGRLRRPRRSPCGHHLHRGRRRGSGPGRLPPPVHGGAGAHGGQRRATWATWQDGSTSPPPATCVSHNRRGIKGRLLGVLAGRAPASGDAAGIVDGPPRHRPRESSAPLCQLAAAAKTLRYPRRA